jgi:NTP pyrophosphatase (non-canonical NTP hydrolase)
MNHELTFQEFQDAQMDFLHRRNLNTTIETQSEKLAEEVPEMMEALAVLQSDYTSEHEKDFAMEIIDVIIVGMGLIGEMGMDTGELIKEKFRITNNKYELVEVLLLQQQGMSPVESMRAMKKRYEANQNRGTGNQGYGGEDSSWSI